MKKTLPIARIALLCGFWCCTLQALLVGQQPPSEKYPPAGAPPVTVRPQQNIDSEPLRMSREQIRQFQVLQQNQQQGGPPRIHRLTDSSLPNLSAVVDTSPQNSNIQQTAFVQENSQLLPGGQPQQTGAPQQELAAPIVPEVHRGGPPIVDSQQFKSLEGTNTSADTAGENLLESQTPALDATGSFGGSTLPAIPAAPQNSTTAEADGRLPAMDALGNVATPEITWANQETQPANFEDAGETPTTSLPPVQLAGQPAGDFNQGGEQLSYAESDNIRVLASAPAIEVLGSGPKSIGIGKTSTFQVKTTNQSQMDSNRIQVQCRLPRWVEISNIITTDGHREVVQEGDGFLVTWVLPRLGGGQSQQMSIDVIPNRAEAFDLALEWQMEKSLDSGRVVVTEPRLEMLISGSDEVQFGDKALYDVTVKNVGTGTAENVQVMLSEALGGARANLNDIAPGANRQFQVELSARTPGELELLAMAVGDANLRTSASRKVIVRRAQLEIGLVAPEIKYAGTVAKYQVQVRNSGDALAQDVTATLNLPTGVKYLSGLNGADVTTNTLQWGVGNLAPGENRTFEINCQMNAAGNVKVDAGARGNNQLVAATEATTRVETVADLVLSVVDPKGPLPTGEPITYTITIKNRGSRAARNVDLAMLFSKGIEPTSAEGLEYRTEPGQVQFSSIGSIEPGQEISVKVVAKPLAAGTHQFRAQLKCTEADSDEVAQGTTKFYGKTIQQTTPARPASSQNQFDSGSFNGGSFNGGGQ